MNKTWDPKVTDAMVKKDRESMYEAILAEAHAAGMEAGEEVQVTPMIVGTPTTPLGSTIDRTKPVYEVEGGCCGFAWIEIYGGNGAFPRYMVRKGISRRNCGRSGSSIWVSHFGQSMVRKEAYARAYAQVLKEHGVQAYMGSRMD